MKRRILFVDDEQSVLDGFRVMLHSQRREWKCAFALSGEQGLAMIQEAPFDVVIADMRMPGMDGADFLKEVERLQPATIRMILSGYSDMQLLLKSARHAHQFLSKPCSSEKLISAIRRVTGLSPILNNEAVRSIVTGLNALPVIPDLYIRITQELERPEPDLKRIAELVQRDVGMTATLMKVVNSSFFGFYRKIKDPAHAVTLLGIDALKGLVLGAHLLSKLDTSSFKGYSVEKLWEHCLQTGYFAKTIASGEGRDRQFVEDCFIAGILHDVGKLVLVTQMDGLYKPVVESVRQEGGPVVVHERQRLGVSHAEVGAYLLGLWGFKQSVVEGVFGHHGANEDRGSLTEALVVHVANALQHELGPANSGYVFEQVHSDWLEAANAGDKLEKWREACIRYGESM